MVEAELGEERCVLGDDALPLLFAVGNRQKISGKAKQTGIKTDYEFSSAMTMDRCEYRYIPEESG